MWTELSGNLARCSAPAADRGARLNQGRYAEAAHELEITLQLTGGKHYKACFNRSLALLRLGRRAATCAQLQVCGAVNPAYERTRQALREHCAAP